MKTLITSKPSVVTKFHPELKTEETKEEKTFQAFDELVDFGQKNSENKVLKIEVLRKDGSTRTTHEFVNFKP